MSRKLTSKCDGCGVEIVEADEPGDPVGILSGLPIGRRRRGTEHWGNLTVATSAFPVSFDLCDACTKRVVDMLELEIPKPEAMMKRYGGLGGHAMFAPPNSLFGPGDAMAPPGSPPMGALSPEDLEALGLKVPNVTPNDVVGLYKCPGCGVLRPGPVPGYACSECQHQD